MTHLSLSGCIILVVEDEPLIALDIAECLQAEGASVHTAHNLAEGLRLADHPDLSAVVMDFGLDNAKGTALCERLKERGVPFMLYTGYDHITEACRSEIILPKPATTEQLLGAVKSMLRLSEVSQVRSARN